MVVFPTVMYQIHSKIEKLELQYSHCSIGRALSKKTYWVWNLCSIFVACIECSILKYCTSGDSVAFQQSCQPTYIRHLSNQEGEFQFHFSMPEIFYPRWQKHYRQNHYLGDPLRRILLFTFLMQISIFMPS